MTFRHVAVLWGLCAVATGCRCGTPPAENQPPTVSILAPADGAMLGMPPHALRGQATDPEDGALSGASLTWTSSLQGALGTGAELSVSLSRGTHELTLEAVDSQGARASATVRVTVAIPNQPPQAFIDAPANGASFDEGTPVVVRGHATDFEDGMLPGASLTWTSDVQGALGTGATVTLANPPLGTSRVLLTAVDSSGAVAYASIAITVVPVGSNHPPVVTLQSPSDGATFTAGQPVTFQGSATDVEDGALAGSALSWRSSVQGALGTGRTVTTASLSLGVHVITLTATDSRGATGTASISIVINPPANQPPIATLQTPLSGATYPAGASITFTGTGQDPEEGSLTGSALTWSSNLDGALGSGSPLTLSTLSSGTHRITLTATDSRGASGVASVNITVLPPNRPPMVSISAPSSGSSFTAGTAITFRGSGTDPEDGALTGASLTWRSDLDGVMGSGESLTFSSLREGTHQISLTATDSKGLSASASIRLTLTPAVVNLPPVAQLLGPTQAEALVPVTFDGSGSADPDGTIARYDFNFGDGTAPVGGTSSQATHAFATAGSYTVTLTVTDNLGATGSTRLTLSVVPPVRRPQVVDSGPDQLGSVCSIALGAGGAPRVAYRDDTHPSLLHAAWSGTAWTRELVDGLGFNRGGEVRPAMSLAVDAAGGSHIGYGIAGKGIWYAGRASGASDWTLEQVDPLGDEKVALALDPSQGNRPVVLYTASAAVTGCSARYLRPTLAARTGPAAWVPASLPGAGGASSCVDYRGLGGLAFDAAGAAYFTYASTSSSYVPQGMGSYAAGVLTVRTFGSIYGASTDWSPLALRAADALVVSPDALYRITLPLGSATTVTRSVFENFTPQQYAVATDGAGQPWIALRHGVDLELAHLDASGYWTRTDLGPMDNAGAGIAVDGAGEARVCFFRDGKLMVY